MTQHTSHLSAESMQAFLEGDLPPGERRPVEEHLAACARCSAELDAWRVLFADLSGLAAPAPRAGFSDRVMVRVQVPAPERQRGWLAAFLPSKSAHVTAELLQDVAEGLVPARRVARMRSHVDACPTCTAELAAWKGVVRQLENLDRFAPREGFAARVMAAVRARVAAPVPARVTVGAPAWATFGARALVTARRFVPRTRRAWAALSGVAVTPAAIFCLIGYAVFSHPTLTPQALGSFVVWQLGDLASTVWTALSTSGPELASASGAGSVLDLLGGSPALLAGLVLVYSAFAAVALRILYKNLIGNRSYARVSAR